MSNKGKLKNGELRKRKKPQYKCTNWSSYNQSLRKRGMISLYFPSGDIKSQFINEEPYKKGVSGQSSTYLEPYIQTMFVLYRLFGWGQRQITGYMEDYWRNLGLEIPVPSFGNLSDRFAGLAPSATTLLNEAVAKTKNNDPVDLIIDSSGLRFGKASDWYQRKYNNDCLKKPWKKMHISMDVELNIHEIAITDDDCSDISMLEKLLPHNLCIRKILADGAYYAMDLVEKLVSSGVEPVIPPPKNAKIQSQANSQWHDKIVKYIKDKGSKYAFFKKYGYGKRELVEAQFSRIKRCLGSSLLTQRRQSQDNEGLIIRSVINTWNSFDRCVSEKIA